MIKIFTVAFFLVNNLFSQNSVVQQFSDSFADVAEAAKPAVVTIITDKVMKIPNNDLYFFFKFGKVFFELPIQNHAESLGNHAKKPFLEPRRT